MSKDSKNNHLLSISLIIICTFVTSIAQYFLKMATGSITNIESILSFNMIFGYILYALGAVIMIIALKYGDLSVIYPFLALSFVWVFLISIIFLGETILFVNWAGLFLIILGVSFIGRGANG